MLFAALYESGTKRRFVAVRQLSARGGNADSAGPLADNRRAANKVAPPNDRGLTKYFRLTLLEVRFPADEFWRSRRKKARGFFGNWLIDRPTPWGTFGSPKCALALSEPAFMLSIRLSAGHPK